MASVEIPNVSVSYATDLFYRRHYNPAPVHFNRDYYKRLYFNIPTILTTFPFVNEIKMYTKDLSSPHIHAYVSRTKLEVNIIDTRLNILINLHAYVYLSFMADENNVLQPVELRRIDFASATYNYEIQI